MISIKNDKQELLKKIKILDIGCGGGLICEPLARMGANVLFVTIDKSSFNSLLNKVDFPTFGLPTIDTKPDLKLIFFSFLAKVIK